MDGPHARARPGWPFLGEGATALTRTLLVILLSLVVFGVFLSITGRDPIAAFQKVYIGTLGSRTGLAEVGVRAIPFVLTALAAAIPARVGLINVGGEGQLYIGAWAATGVALYSGGPIWVMLPAMMIAGFAAGAMWGGIAIALRNLRGVNEVISTLLLNYVGILLVNVFVFGPWKSPTGNNYPYTPTFHPNAILQSFGDTRFHLGIILPLLAVTVFTLVQNKTRWGFNMRAVGGNPEAARRRGIPVGRYLTVAMLVGGGVAGLAGMAEVSGVQHHLRPGISSGYGYFGFLASWMADHHPIALVGTGSLLALVTVGGDLLQFSADLPSAAMNILIGLMLFMVLGMRPLKRATA